MPHFESEALYIQSGTTLLEKICNIDKVIDALELLALTSVVNQGVEEYSLDNGQSKIRTRYRSHQQIATAILGFEQIKQRYVNRLNGNITILKDKQSFLH